LGPETIPSPHHMQGSNPMFKLIPTGKETF
jgi:hypothetical protein